MSNSNGSIGWMPPRSVTPAPEIVGWGDEIIGWGNELIGGVGPEIIGACRCEIGRNDGAAGVGTDREWAEFAGRYNYAEDRIGFIPLLVAGAAAIAGAVSAGAATAAAVVAPIVTAVGGVQAVASMVGGGIAAAQGLIKAAEGGDKKALEKLKKLKSKDAKKKAEQAKRLRNKAEAKLAEVMQRARAGDLKAQAILAGIEILKSETTQKVAATAKGMKVFGIVPPKDLVWSAAQASAARTDESWKRFMDRALAAAKKSGKWKKEPPKVKLPIAAMKKSAEAAGIAKLRAAAKKLPSAQAASRGYFVAPGGRVVRGEFALVRS